MESIGGRTGAVPECHNEARRHDDAGGTVGLQGGGASAFIGGTCRAGGGRTWRPASSCSARTAACSRATSRWRRWASAGRAMERVQAYRGGRVGGREARCSTIRRNGFTGWDETTMSQTTHQDLILDQFTRQATPFSTASHDHRCECAADDRGGGAPKAGDTRAGRCVRRRHRGVRLRTARGACDGDRHDTGDAGAREVRLAAEKGIGNVTWDRGDVTALPYADGAFDIVVTRFSMHHFLDPLGVLHEMVRVCAPGGRVVVVDMHASRGCGEGGGMEPRGEAARSIACALPDAERATRGTSRRPGCRSHA